MAQSYSVRDTLHCTVTSCPHNNICCSVVQFCRRSTRPRGSKWFPGTSGTQGVPGHSRYPPTKAHSMWLIHLHHTLDTWSPRDQGGSRGLKVSTYRLTHLGPWDPEGSQGLQVSIYCLTHLVSPGPRRFPLTPGIHLLPYTPGVPGTEGVPGDSRYPPTVLHT